MQETAKPLVRSRRNAITGAIFIAIAAGFGIEALNYPLGSPIRMGPGFIPLTLAGILATLGLIILIGGLREDERIDVAPIPWAGGALVMGSLILFGLFARQLGLVPIVFVCTTLTAMASKNNTIVSALTIAAVLSAACYLIFKVGLGITLPTFGPLFSF